MIQDFPRSAIIQLTLIKADAAIFENPSYELEEYKENDDLI